jgi:hypothetical protein
MNRPLDSDQLGQLGETEFEALCVRAGLVPNPSTWDRKGWDFVVDWRETGSTLPHDRRPTPRSCLVQVKTVWQETRSVRIRLASIDHLAKDLKPAFVVVTKINNELEIVEAGIAHLEGEFLAYVLKALREASASGTSIGSVHLDLSVAKWFSPLSLDHHSVRQAMEDAIGPSMEVYSSHKQRQLRDLGFEDARFVIRGAIVAADEDALVDGLWGLHSLELVDATAEEMRFGIPLPLDEFSGSGTLNIQTKPHDSCRIVARQQGRELPHTFKGKMFIAPRDLMSPGRMKMLIRSDHFSLTLDGRKGHEPNAINFTLNLTVEAGLANKRMSVTEWAELYGFLAALDGNEPLRLEVHPYKLPGPFSGTIKLEIDRDAALGWSRAGALAEAAAIVFGRAGWPAAKGTFNEFASAERALRNLATLLKEPSEITPLKISTEPVVGFDPSEAVELICCHYLHAGEHMITYTVAADLLPTVLDDRIDWISQNLKVMDVSRSKPSRKGFDAYVQTSLSGANATSFYIAAYDAPQVAKKKDRPRVDHSPKNKDHA